VTLAKALDLARIKLEGTPQRFLLFSEAPKAVDPGLGRGVGPNASAGQDRRR
jgi:hypothetical protein